MSDHKRAIPIVIGVFGLVGVVLIARGFAATPLSYFEGESSQLSGCVSSIDDATASGGKALSFDCQNTTKTYGATLPISYTLSSLTGTVRYIAPSGNDTTGTGTVSQPFATIAKAFAVSASGDTIVARGGEYRGQANMNISKSIKIIAYPGETPVFNGAVKPSGWVSEAALKYIAYTPRPIATGGGIPFGDVTNLTNLKADGVGRYPDQVWQGATPLKQILDITKLVDGTFYVDRTSNRLYMTANDVNKGSIEVSQPADGAYATRDRFVLISAPDVKIEGIKVTRYSPNAADFGVIIFDQPASRGSIKNVELSDAPYEGLRSSLNDNVVADSITLNRIGLMGITTNQTDNMVIRNVKITNGDYFDEFKSSPASGAIKTSRTRGTKIENSMFADNNSHGIWFDQSNINTTVANNSITGNDGAGIFFEISDGLLMVNNYVNAPAAFQAAKLSGSSGLKLVNNTLVGGVDPLAVYTDGRSSPGCARDITKCLAGAGGTGSDYQGRFTPPASLDWMPRIDYMVNNVVGYPAGSSLCQSITAFCITTYHSTSKASAPIETIIHKADTTRGIPQTFMKSNVYANGTGTIIRYTDSQGGYNFTSLAPFTTAMAGGSVSISGIETSSLSGNGYFSADGTTSSSLVHANALALPTDAAINAYLPSGYRFYGSNVK